MSSFMSRYGCKTCDMSYLTKSLIKHENMYFWYPTMMMFSSDTNVIDTYFYQWVFSHRVPVVKQVVFHLFAFKLDLKVYLCVLFLQACVFTMDINDLPSEVLTKIFSYLPQLDLLTTINTVCHHWNKAAFSRSLWKTININYSTDDKLDIYLQNIAHYRDFVQNLAIKRDHLIKFFDIRKTRNLSNLRNLQITSYQPDEDLNSAYSNQIVYLAVYRFCQIFNWEN